MRRSCLTLAIWLSIAPWMLALGGCGDADAERSRVAPDTVADDLRLVSLSPALTQILVDLGLADHIVGCYGTGTYRDPAAPESAVVVGDLYQLDYEKLFVLKPTHVFIQPPAGGVPHRLESLARDHGWVLSSYKIEDIEAVKRAVYAADGESIGAAVGRPAEAQKLNALIDRQLDAIASVTADVTRPRVLIIIGIEAQSAAGPDTFLSQMLQIAGGANALTESAILYPTFDKERLLTLKPDVIVLVSGIAAAGRARSAMQMIPDDWNALGIPALEQERVLLLTHAFAAIPSTRMPEVTAQLAKQLHPDLRDRIDQALSEALAQ